MSPNLLGFISPRDEMHLGGSGWKLSKINQRESESSDGAQPHRLTHTIPTIREAEKGGQDLLGPQYEFKASLGNLVSDILPQNKNLKRLWVSQWLEHLLRRQEAVSSIPSTRINK